MAPVFHDSWARSSGVPGVPPSAAPAVLQRPSLSRSPYLQATPLVPGENGPWVPTQRQEQFVNHFWGGLGVPGFTAFSLSASAAAHSHPAEPLARPDTPQTTARPPSSHRDARRGSGAPTRSLPPRSAVEAPEVPSRMRLGSPEWLARTSTSGLRALLGLLAGTTGLSRTGMVEAGPGRGMLVS